ncbi:phosphoglycolate phosphatase [Catenovulum agarivorans DS-2]|uniref:Phosphoglycolate phosphatase n=1 Tax=Catenovulum agarivorans DS-2 TaxID=1328313 RepID=W7QTX4_9ALTE|nr:HAD-IA family hydrolase [Catenovulum agarivorans]EWH08890.1 phosphoglycolate phosphatase [Catenovulum agarivorans DS-2]
MREKTLTKPQGILFDLDGTLLDTAQDLGETLNYVLSTLNKPPVSYQQYRPVASHGAAGLLKLGLGENWQSYDVEKLRRIFLDYYLNNISVHTEFFDGMAETLSQLNYYNIAWGVVTNKPAFLTDVLLTQYPEFRHSQINVSGDTLKVRKPDPAPLLHACQHMQINAEQCWYVGDAHRDIEAGNRAGMQTFVANWGYTQDERPVSQWQANHIIEHPCELISYFS